MKHTSFVDQNQAYAFLVVIGTLVATAVISAQFVQAQLVTPRVDLSIVLSTPKSIQTNSVGRMTVNTTNRGTLGASSNTVSLRLPQGFAYAEPLPTGCTVNGTIILNCTVPSIQSGQTNRIAVNVLATPAFACNKTGVLSATVRTSTENVDSDLKNNTTNTFLSVTCGDTGTSESSRSSSSQAGVSDLSASRYEKQTDLLMERPGLVVVKVTNNGPDATDRANVMITHDRWMEWNPTTIGVATCTRTTDTQVSCMTRRIAAGDSLLVPVSFTPGRELGLNTLGKFTIGVEHGSPVVSGGRQGAPVVGGRVVVDRNFSNNFYSLNLRIQRNWLPQ